MLLCTAGANTMVCAAQCGSLPSAAGMYQSPQNFAERSLSGKKHLCSLRQTSSSARHVLLQAGSIVISMRMPVWPSALCYVVCECYVHFRL